MFDSSSSNYRRLNRNGNGFSRNVYFFCILVGLVASFSIFYLYISASNDLTALRFEFNNQAEYVTKLKNDILEVNVRLEELKLADSTCKDTKLSLQKQYDECSTNLKSTKNEKEQLDESLKNSQTKNNEISALLESQRTNISAMKSVGINQEALIIKLNETIDALRRDLILKDELIKKLEEPKPGVEQRADFTRAPLPEPTHTLEVKEFIQDKPLSDHTIPSTKSSLLDPQVKDARPDVLAPPESPEKAKPGDRVKIAEANDQKENDSALLQAAVQQDAKTADDSPVLRPPVQTQL